MSVPSPALADDHAVASRSLRTCVVVVATLAAFVTPFMGSSVNVAVPALAAEFRMGAYQLNWVLTAYLVACAMFLLPFGRAADLYGRRRFFTAGLAVFTASSLLSGWSTGPAFLIAARAAQGMGAAMIFGTSLAILTGVFPPGQRGRVIGLNVAAVYIGLSVGPVAGGFLTDAFGWRSIFHVNAALGLVALVATLAGLRAEWRDTHGHGLDTLGAVLYAVGVGLAMTGLAAVRTSSAGVWALAAGAALLVLFVYQELRTRHPMLALRLFRNAAFSFSNLAALIHYSATAALGLLLSLFLQSVQGYSARETGFVLFSQPLLMALVSPLAGILSDRFEPRYIASAGMAMTCAGLAWFGMLSPGTGVAPVVCALVVVGAGFGLFSSPNTNAIMSSVDRGHYGVASSAVGTMRMVGQALSLALVTLLFAIYLGDQPVHEAGPDLVPCLRVAFRLFAALCAVGVCASMARGRLRPANTTPGVTRDALQEECSR